MKDLPKEWAETKEAAEKMRRVSEYNLTSDLFAGKVFEDLGACQELCRILLQNENIRLKNVKTQYVIRNLKTHSVELDIMAEDICGNVITVEIQMYQEKSPFRRSRYYLSCIDTSILEKGKPYDALPDVTMIYITKGDFLNDKRGCYHFVRKTDGQEITMELDNGLHEWYYNLEYPTDDMRINELKKYFIQSDPLYQTENFPRIVERVRYFKMEREGVHIMCEITDRIRKEGREEGRKEGVLAGKVEAVLELLADFGKIPQQLLQRIGQESDPVVLSRWLKCAASVSSIAEFEANM